MTLDSKGRAFIQSREGLRMEAYLDGGGIPTIGYGTTVYPSGNHVKIGDTCTDTYASVYFEHDLKSFEEAVNGMVLISGSVSVGYMVGDLTQNQFNALVSLCYNIGRNNFKVSSVRRNVNSANRGNVMQMTNAFMAWNKIRINGTLTVSYGLTSRRRKEVELYFT